MEDIVAKSYRELTVKDRGIVDDLIVALHMKDVTIGAAVKAIALALRDCKNLTHRVERLESVT